MSTADNELTELRDRIQAVLSSRIVGAAGSKHDIDEKTVTSIADHYTAMRAVEWFMETHKF